MSTTALPLPVLCGRYRCDRQEGKGGMGVVYLATDTDERFRQRRVARQGDEQGRTRPRTRARS